MSEGPRSESWMINERMLASCLDLPLNGLFSLTKEENKIKMKLCF